VGVSSPPANLQISPSIAPSLALKDKFIKLGADKPRARNQYESIYNDKRIFLIEIRALSILIDRTSYVIHWVVRKIHSVVQSPLKRMQSSGKNRGRVTVLARCVERDGACAMQARGAIIPKSLAERTRGSFVRNPVF